MYVIAGVSGNTGSVVAETLLAKGQKVRVLVRDAAKGESWKARGAEVAVASLEDAASLERAFAGAKGVYGLVPPDVAHPDPKGRAAKIVDAFARAIAASKVEHAVFLSSVGAQHATGTGVIETLAAAEKTLRAQQVPVTFVRAAFFLENWASNLPPAEKDGVLPSFEQTDRTFAMVATKDIGLTVANALLEPSSTHRTIELAGPMDLSPNEIAKVAGAIYGRAVKALHVPYAQQAPALVGYGMSPATAELFAGLSRGIDDGTVDWEKTGTTFLRGTTTAETVLRKLAGR